MRIRHIYIFALLLLCWACVDPFDPPEGNYEDLLVVEAFLSDDDTTQTIRLSRSYPIDTTQIIPVSDATVYVEDDAGNSFVFQQANAGDYIIQPEDFTPQVGRQYVLRVELGASQRYISAPVEMKPAQQIDDLYFEPATFVDGSGNVVNGFKVAVNSKGPAGETGYFRYEWEETYKTVPPFGSSSVYNRDTGTIEERTDNISECWVSNSSSSIILATTDGLSVNEIQDQAVRYVSFESAEINQRYSILVKQIPLDKSGYEFWTNLLESNESAGSLFDTQPFPLTGNLRNIEDPQEAVLGYFDVASVTSQRLFIDNNDVPSEQFVPSLWENCRANAGDTLVAYGLIPTFDAQSYLISYEVFPEGYLMVPRRCIDCTTKGTNVRPEFWIE